MKHTEQISDGSPGVTPGLSLKVIARMQSDFPEKFGIPRQSGLVPELYSRIIMEPEYRKKEAFDGLEGYSHLWLIWEFSKAVRETWSPTVRPPRLGGNTRKGVFATRSPFRPNALGLSCVELVDIVMDDTYGPVLVVSGADLMDGTPIYDIKPYLPMTEAHPDARSGFAGKAAEYHLQVEFPEELLSQFSEQQQKALLEILAEDPRPAYQDDPDRIYGMAFAGRDIHFSVKEQTLFVRNVVKR